MRLNKGDLVFYKNKIVEVINCNYPYYLVKFNDEKYVINVFVDKVKLVLEKHLISRRVL